MRAFVLHAERRGRLDLEDPAQAPASTVWANPVLRIEDVPEPRIEAPHDVIVRVATCGICGSDVHCAQPGRDGYVSFGGPARLPAVLGHEFAGTVERVGNAVDNVAPGDVVTAESMSACWRCDECRAGHLNECRRIELLGLTMNGALAPLVRVDARHCYNVEAIVRRYGWQRGIELSALMEPMGVAWRGLTRARFTQVDRVVVLGAGPIGLAVILLAKAAGAAHVIAFDLTESRVTLARAAGATAFNLGVLTDGEVSVEKAIRTALGSASASLAVEAGGTPEAFHAAFASLANRGRLLVLGRMPARVPLDTNALLSRSLEVIGSRGHAGGSIFSTLIDKVADGAIDPAPLITARFGFPQLPEAFAHASKGTGGKTLISLEST
jgi:hypothetical protein